MKTSGTKLLKGRHVLVTGAAGTIGQAIVARMRDHGARCMATDREPGDGCDVCDVTSEASVAHVFDHADATAPITDVVHAAGVLSLGPVADCSVEEFRHVLEVNLVGSFVVGRESARRLPDGGTLTFLSSQAGIKGGANWAAYAASKGGVNRLVDCLVEELGPRRIRVNAVCPGGVDTPMMRQSVDRLADLAVQSPDDMLRCYLTGVPLGRFATPDEIGDVCAMIASPLASYISGVLLPVDGGEMTR